MATSQLQRPGLWEISSRVIVYAAIGAALYGVLGLFSFVLPGTQNVSVRPAFAIVTFFGYSFGPVVGLFTGLVGNAVIDQLSGYGLLTAWNWSIANGLAGLIAGLLGAGALAAVGGSKIVGSAVVAAVAVVVGFLFVITDIWVFGNSLETAITASYLPVVVADVIAGVILTPILVAAWEPLRESLGR